MIRFESGSCRVSVLSAGSLRLDGGAMFGVVPKPLWAKARPADDRNRILLGMNVLLVEDGDRVTLVDSGAGTKWDAKHKEIYGFEPKTPEEILAPAGLTPDAVSVVVCSHLHFDHAGGNTVRDGSGDLAPAFPNARYVVQRGELDFARLDNERIRASYERDNFEPIAGAGLFDLVEGDLRIAPRIEVRVAPGHTPHLQIVLVDTGEHVVAFLADLVPTTSHLPYPWIMGYDVEPLRTLASKKRILPAAVRERWWCVFEHDADVPLGTLEERNGRLGAVPVGVEA